MSLKAALEQCRTEEDVKDAYIQALGLKGYSKNLIDIQTEEIWFEAKEGATSPIQMFAQLLFYVRAARKKGDHIPSFLCVIDREKAAIMETSKALPILKDTTIKWPKSASQITREYIAQVAPYIEAHFVVYRMDTAEHEFISAIKEAITAGRLVRTPITPDNLRQVFDKWVDMIGQEIEGIGETDYALLFFADIMHDGKNAAMDNLPAELLHKGEQPVFSLNGKIYPLSSTRGYRNFWAIYHRPPYEGHRAYLLERRDSLLPLDERSFKGAFYTPLHVVDKAYDLLTETLGKNWQQRYLVWDMCCGVGNLETKHSNYRNVFMSTLDQADIDVMRASRTCLGATKFQYDYLNDDITDAGEIDYSLSEKMPKALRQAIEDAKSKKPGARKILVLINPPYAEAMNVDNITASNGKNAEMKSGISKTGIGASMGDLGYAGRELFIQFLIRIRKELPNAIVAIFSTLKYFNAPNFSLFRQQWQAQYLNGFVIHSQAFDGLKGNFPIGFLIWNQAKRSFPSSIVTQILDKNAEYCGDKEFFREPGQDPLSEWITRPRSNHELALPLKNAITPTTSNKDVRGTRWADDAIGSMICPGNDLQHAGLTAVLSSGYCSAGGMFITRGNISQAAIVFSVRRLIRPTWLNDRDQFLQPSSPLTEEFKHDCLVWMLFNGSNLSAGADGLEWNDQTWSLVNHFIPYTERQVGAADKFQSDFMVRYIKTQKIKFSAEAQAVLDAGLLIWQLYHKTLNKTGFAKSIREKYKLNRPDVGWYQIRNALTETDPNTDFSAFKAAYEELTVKLRPLVFSFGFLKA